ncbi:MAG: flavin monoamine oxidase family protein [Solirubrobacterales bacterium]|nr:flavin monoamine oxidase family protein [Solirubrobacterales bacterium]
MALTLFGARRSGILHAVGGERIETEVVVVGAGLAGLSAARELTRLGIDCQVVEARDRVGGRLLNEPIGDGEIVELGGQWVGPTQDRVLDLISDLGLETFPTWCQGSNLFERAGKARRYDGTIPKLNPISLAEVGMALKRLEKMAARVDVEQPWKQLELADWDAETFATWMKRNSKTPAARDLLRLAIQAVWAAEPEDVSLLHALFYVKSGGGSLELMLDAADGAQDSRVVGGTQLIAERMAAELGDRVHLGFPVRRIRWRQMPGDVEEQPMEVGPHPVSVESDELTVSARAAVVALPPAVAGRLEYDPILPAVRDGLTQRMVQGTVVKCHAIYSEPFWRAEGLSGQATSADGPVSVTFDNSPPSGSPGVLLAFLEGNAARRATDLPPDERRHIVLDCLVRLFGPKAGKPEHFVDKAWAADEFARGCYGGYLPPGAWMTYGEALRRPVGPLHWAGAETATVWAGYMDGAISSGTRAASEIAAGT